MKSPKMSTRYPAGSQEHLYWKAHEKTADGNEAFLEIQQGPNPLTPEEIDRLCDRRPHLWERFRGYGAKAIAAKTKAE